MATDALSVLALVDVLVAVGAIVSGRALAIVATVGVSTRSSIGTWFRRAGTVAVDSVWTHAFVCETAHWLVAVGRIAGFVTFTMLALESVRAQASGHRVVCNARPPVETPTVIHRSDGRFAASSCDELTTKW